MKIVIEIKKNGGCNDKQFWSYNIFIDGKFADCPPLIYRRWMKKETALKNAIKQLQKIVK